MSCELFSVSEGRKITAFLDIKQKPVQYFDVTINLKTNKEFLWLFLSCDISCIRVLHDDPCWLKCAPVWFNITLRYVCNTQLGELYFW